MKISGYRVVSVASPGMAAEDALYGEITALEWAILSDGLHAILATGRGIAA